MPDDSRAHEGCEGRTLEELEARLGDLEAQVLAMSTDLEMRVWELERERSSRSTSKLRERIAKLSREL